MFSASDIRQLQYLGIEPAQAAQQIEDFRNGFPYMPVIAPATAGKGIVQVSDEEQTELVHLFDQWGGSRLKFVPASGAATRMFKSLYELRDTAKATPETDTFFKRLPDFAFYDDLMNVVKDAGHNNPQAVLNGLLEANGLNYGQLPKGLLKFHRYTEGSRTAFEEHLVEAALYAKDDKNVARLHFTVSPEHAGKFNALLKKVQPDYEKRYGVTYEITFSEQKKSTDTLAVELDNTPFRNADGSLLFRPGGHGALLENLAEIKEDIVFIKNIDNVAPDRLKPDTIHWKKVLAGMMLMLRSRIAAYLAELEQGVSSVKLKEIATFIAQNFCITLPEVEAGQYAALLYAKLNRPMRVCGMVKNAGEPGGGPFLARNADGSQSLQIVESSQIDLHDASVEKIFRASTHFNPVDVVCSFRDYKGGVYDLRKFRDPATGFISQKSKDGRTLKALELPGLWNGAMSDWTTIFVEVPLSTFSPVKTVTDLLRHEHQAEISD
ncbi:MAG: DUF4301 family protein [Prevotellaceae bacterium]|jgi:hypothetical protein|nr:DUF4301 family protein [Prevotellaceae bacterium]